MLYTCSKFAISPIKNTCIFTPEKYRLIACSGGKRSSKAKRMQRCNRGPSSTSDQVSKSRFSVGPAYAINMQNSTGSRFEGAHVKHRFMRESARKNEYARVKRPSGLKRDTRAWRVLESLKIQFQNYETRASFYLTRIRYFYWFISS